MVKSIHCRMAAGWALLVVGAAQAAELVPPPAISPPDSWLMREVATLRLLDKIDSTVETVNIKVGEVRAWRSLSIDVLGCAVRPPDLRQDAAAHVRITDSKGESAAFDGWILQAEPGLNMLEHPVYDVQLVACR